MPDIIGSYVTLTEICKSPFKELTGLEHYADRELFLRFIHNVQTQSIMEKIDNVQAILKMILDKE